MNSCADVDKYDSEPVKGVRTEQKTKGDDDPHQNGPKLSAGMAKVTSRNGKVRCVSTHGYDEYMRASKEKRIIIYKLLNKKSQAWDALPSMVLMFPASPCLIHWNG